MKRTLMLSVTTATRTGMPPRATPSRLRCSVLGPPPSVLTRIFILGKSGRFTAKISKNSSQSRSVGVALFSHNMISDSTVRTTKLRFGCGLRIVVTDSSQGFELREEMPEHRRMLDHLVPLVCLGDELDAGHHLGNEFH